LGDDGKLEVNVLYILGNEGQVTGDVVFGQGIFEGERSIDQQ
jgi:hypothetical protein